MAYKKNYRVAIDNKVYRVPALAYIMLMNMDATSEQNKAERDSFLENIQKTCKLLLTLDSNFNY